MKTFISIIIGAAIIVGGYFLLKTDSPKEAVTTSQAPSATTTGTPEKKMAFSQFMKQGGSYKCTVNQYLGSIGGPATTGTIYLNNTMVRAEYATKIQSTPIEVHLIVKDGFSYAWSSIMPNAGYKMKAVINQKPGATAPTSGSYAFNADQIGDYDCQSWTADASFFALPAGVTFKEM